MTAKLRGAMAPTLSPREREVFDIVEELGDPHVVEILACYHRRHEDPIEATSLVLALRSLIEKGLVTSETRSAPQGAAIDQRVHFRATPDALLLVHHEPPQLSDELLHFLRVMLLNA